MEPQVINIDELADRVADKLFKKLKGENLVRRDAEIAKALQKKMITVYEVGELRILGVGYHSLNQKIKNGEFVEGTDYEIKNGKKHFYTRRIKQLMNK